MANPTNTYPHTVMFVPVYLAPTIYISLDKIRSPLNRGPNNPAKEEIRGVAIKKPDSCSNPLLKKNQTIEKLSPSM